MGHINEGKQDKSNIRSSKDQVIWVCDVIEPWKPQQLTEWQIKWHDWVVLGVFWFGNHFRRRNICSQAWKNVFRICFAIRQTKISLRQNDGKKKRGRKKVLCTAHHLKHAAFCFKPRDTRGFQQHWYNRKQGQWDEDRNVLSAPTQSSSTQPMGQCLTVQTHSKLKHAVGKTISWSEQDQAAFQSLRLKMKAETPANDCSRHLEEHQTAGKLIFGDVHDRRQAVTVCGNVKLVKLSNYIKTAASTRQMGVKKLRWERTCTSGPYSLKKQQKWRALCQRSSDLTTGSTVLARI